MKKRDIRGRLAVPATLIVCAFGVTPLASGLPGPNVTDPEGGGSVYCGSTAVYSDTIDGTARMNTSLAYCWDGTYVLSANIYTDVYGSSRWSPASGFQTNAFCCIGNTSYHVDRVKAFEDQHAYGYFKCIENYINVGGNGVVFTRYARGPYDC